MSQVIFTFNACFGVSPRGEIGKHTELPNVKWKNVLIPICEALYYALQEIPDFAIFLFVKSVCDL
jgi:hypothetical protein